MKSHNKETRQRLSARDLDLIIRQTSEKQQVIFLKLQAVLVEVQELRAETRKLRSVVLTLLADPQAREDAVAVLKEWSFKEETHIKKDPS